MKKPEPSFARLVAIHAERLASDIEDRFGGVGGNAVVAHPLRRALVAVITTYVARGAMTIHDAAPDTLPTFAEPNPPVH